MYLNTENFSHQGRKTYFYITNQLSLLKIKRIKDVRFNLITAMYLTSITAEQKEACIALYDDLLIYLYYIDNKFVTYCTQ